VAVKRTMRMTRMVRIDVIAKQCPNAACSPAKQKARDVTPSRAKCSRKRDKGFRLCFVSNLPRRFLELDLGPMSRPFIAAVPSRCGSSVLPSSREPLRGDTRTEDPLEPTPNKALDFWGEEIYLNRYRTLAVRTSLPIRSAKMIAPSRGIACICGTIVFRRSNCPHCRPKIFTKLKQRLVPNLLFQYREPQASRHSRL
jgi:hypothetical protein